MGQDFRRTYRPQRRGRCGAALHAWRPGPWLCTHTRIKPKPEKASVVEASLFSSLGRLRAKDYIVFAGAGLCVDGPGLVGETLDVRHHLILGALRHANREFAARIGAVLPTKFPFARSADVELHARERESFVGEHGSADQKVIGVAVFLLAAVCRRRRLRLGSRGTFLNWRLRNGERNEQRRSPQGDDTTNRHHSAP